MNPIVYIVHSEQDSSQVEACVAELREHLPGATVLFQKEVLANVAETEIILLWCTRHVKATHKVHALLQEAQRYNKTIWSIKFESSLLGSLFGHDFGDDYSRGSTFGWSSAAEREKLIEALVCRLGLPMPFMHIDGTKIEAKIVTPQTCTFQVGDRQLQFDTSQVFRFWLHPGTYDISCRLSLQPEICCSYQITVTEQSQETPLQFFLDEQLDAVGYETVIHEPDGSVYQGRVQHHHYNGTGELRCPDGKLLQGEWLDGHLTGLGSIFYPNGDRLDGKFAEGHLVGKVYYFWQDGRMYRGDHQEEQLTGKGTLILADGTKMKGFFVNGVLQEQ